MEKFRYKFKVQAYEDRMAIAKGFLNSGYTVSITAETVFNSQQDESDPNYTYKQTFFYVVVESATPVGDSDNIVEISEAVE